MTLKTGNGTHQYKAETANTIKVEPGTQPLYPIYEPALPYILN